MADAHIDLLRETIYAALDGLIPAGVALRDGQIESDVRRRHAAAAGVRGAHPAHLLRSGERMTKRNDHGKARIAALEADGFDKCRPSWEGVHVGCSQCEALVIQGVATHETGCPNAPRRAAGGSDD